mmetsp:Transcript_12688/g.18650  ORF Transcript_12688/g.18650 Transcript_12688/m.18650 type:complete len:892 (+) Transcript_12688:44-2719(+)
MTSSKLIHHSAAASSSSHTLLWVEEDDETTSIVYSSHGIINICRCFAASVGSNVGEPVWSVVETLRTSSCGDTSAKRSITAMCSLRCSSTGAVMGFASGFSDGTVNVWRKKHKDGQDGRCWTEQVLQAPGASSSITDIDGITIEPNYDVTVVVATSTGASLLSTESANSYVVAKFAVNTINLHHFKDLNQTVLLMGTAAPRHNKIHVYWFDHTLEASMTEAMKPRYVGCLLGHEDWLTDFSWERSKPLAPLLASGSQDARIRLWKFKTTLGKGITTVKEEEFEETNEEDFDIPLDLDEDEGEARLEIGHSLGMTRVTLEALLYGHEEPITSIEWHPHPQSLYKEDRILLSSSMDRTILIWSSSAESGIWSPLTRVGAAGGILGGSIGSTLLGFLGVKVEPRTGEALIGHAYGGALHLWSLQRDQSCCHEATTSEELVLGSQWKASPCITGHFDNVTDCCWEASQGEYLLTVSSDQTCRLWGNITTLTEGKEVWVELARPQVHGYNLTAITSISTAKHRHIIVTGADEKEIRVFDAPLKFIQLLRHALHNYRNDEKILEEDELQRVERAYIPSLGLSNKSSAADSAKEDTEYVAKDSPDSTLHLPLERDLGAVSLWPEVGKLYGHNTELFCVESTLSAKSSGIDLDGPFVNDILVASSTKARDVKDASIRIWDVSKNKCIQVLSGGHKSTIASLSFSPDGRFLASSGKDRRICIWERKKDISLKEESLFELATAIDSAHKRIVWSLHFCPFDTTLLASGSRDGSVKIWRITECAFEDGNRSQIRAEVLHNFESSSKTAKDKSEAVTAVSFAPLPYNEMNKMLAIGLENGLVEIWGIEDSACNLLHAIEPTSCHFATITKLCWKPLNEEGKALILASTSADHGCRIFSIGTNL